jgi:3-methyladenine DNA glycosylase/8-oxoguanine DNA glycosylase
MAYAKPSLAPVENIPKNQGDGAKKKSAGSPGGKEKNSKKQKAAKELAAEMKVLRSAFKEIVEHFCLRLDSELAEIIRVLEKDPILNEPIVLPSAKISQQLAEKIHCLKLKPSKGKLKEIVQIYKLAEKIAQKMPVQP